MEAPPSLRSRKKAQVREAIYSAAMELFAGRGFDATTVDDIAARAGVSRKTYFNYFPTKGAVLRYYGDQLQARLEDLVHRSAPQQPPLERIYSALGAAAQETAAHREHIRVIYLYSARDPGYLSTISPARQRIWDLITELVAAGQATGQIRPDLPARELAMHIGSVFQGIMLAHVMAGAPMQPLLNSAWRFILGGLKQHDPVAT